MEKRWFVKGSFCTGLGGFPVAKNHPHLVCFNLSWVLGEVIAMNECNVSKMYTYIVQQGILSKRPSI